MRCILLYVLLIFLSCGNQTHESPTPMKLEGLIEFKFEKMSGITEYWLTSKTLKVAGNTYYLIPSTDDIIAEILLDCEEELKVFRNLSNGSTNARNIYDLEQYQNSTSRDFYMHTGGDVYEINDSTLVISFRIGGDFLVFNKQFCNNLFRSSSYSCPHPVQEVFFPVAVVLDIERAWSLPNDHLLKEGYNSYSKPTFKWNECD